MKQACVLRKVQKVSAGGKIETPTHHTTFFVSAGTEFNYAFFLVRHMGVLSQGLASFFAESQVLLCASTSPKRDVFPAYL
jgi:hypothetical protein